MPSTSTSCSACGRSGQLRRGWCDMHYRRWLKNGDPGPAAPMFIVGDDRGRFESKVDRSGGPDSCHPFLGNPDSHGYCHVRMDGKVQQAHVVAWKLANDSPVPDGFDIDHECHNRAVRAGICRPGICAHRRCCNERHLAAKSRQRHAADSPARPGSKGSANANARLTEDQALAVKMALASGMRQVDIGRQYGITQGMVSRINRGCAWTHLSEYYAEAERHEAEREAAA